jgi:Rrf2 family protein
MKISALEEYGLRCMVQLARCTPGESLTIGGIAEREGMSMANARKLLMILREAGLVRSVRGRSGGYALDRDASSLTLGHILEALGGRLYDKRFCERFVRVDGPCVASRNCALRALWGALDGVVSGILHRMTLAEVARD